MPLSRQEIEWNYYSNGYSSKYEKAHSGNAQHQEVYTYNPQKITEIKSFRQKRQHKKRKLNAKGKVALLLLITFFFGLVSPFFLRNITKSILFGIKSNPNVKIDKYNYLYKPTSKYLYNSDYMNTKALVGTPKKVQMQPIYTTKELTDLKQILKNQIASNPKIEATVFVWDTSNGNYVDIEGDKPFPAASIIKIPILISLFKSIEAGKFQKTDTISLEEYYRSEGSGGLQYKQEGIALTIDNLARIMITDSDNSATNMLISAIGSMTAVNNDIKSWGLKNTQINTWLPDMGGTNYTTTKDLAIMLHNLDNEAFLNLNSRADIFDYMGHVKNNRLLAAGIPANASIAHKTGDIGTMVGDAGIIYSPNGKKYIVAIMVKRPYNDFSGKDFIVNASQTIYQYMTNQ